MTTNNSTTEHGIKNQTHLPEKNWKENLLKKHREELETLQRMKQEEKQEHLSNGRRKWFNKQIKSKKQVIKRLEKEVENSE